MFSHTVGPLCNLLLENIIFVCVWLEIELQGLVRHLFNGLVSSYSFKNLDNNRYYYNYLTLSFVFEESSRDF